MSPLRCASFWGSGLCLHPLHPPVSVLCERLNAGDKSSADWCRLVYSLCTCVPDRTPWRWCSSVCGRTVGRSWAQPPGSKGTFEPSTWGKAPVVSWKKCLLTIQYILTIFSTNMPPFYALFVLSINTNTHCWWEGCLLQYHSNVWVSMIFFSKDALNWSKVPVETFIILNKCFSDELSIHKICFLKKVFNNTKCFLSSKPAY